MLKVFPPLHFHVDTILRTSLLMFRRPRIEQNPVDLRDGQHNLLERLRLRGHSASSGHPRTPALCCKTTGRSESKCSLPSAGRESVPWKHRWGSDPSLLAGKLKPNQTAGAETSLKAGVSHSPPQPPLSPLPRQPVTCSLSL